MLEVIKDLILGLLSLIWEIIKRLIRFILKIVWVLLLVAIIGSVGYAAIIFIFGHAHELSECGSIKVFFEINPVFDTLVIYLRPIGLCIDARIIRAIYEVMDPDDPMVVPDAPRVLNVIIDN